MIIRIVCLLTTFYIFSIQNLFALETKTHRYINEFIAANMVNGFSLHNYLIDEPGFSNGSNKILAWYKIQKASEWLDEGGEREGLLQWYLPLYCSSWCPSPGGGFPLPPSLGYETYTPSNYRSSIGIKDYKGNVVAFSYYAGANIDLDIRVQTDVPLKNESAPEEGYDFSCTNFRRLNMAAIKAYFPNLGAHAMYVHLASPKE